jgi:hypothetical protein
MRFPCSGNLTRTRKALSLPPNVDPCHDED